MRKRILSILLTVFMLVGLIPISAFATEGKQPEPRDAVAPVDDTVEEYLVWVGGVQVTSANKDNITEAIQARIAASEGTITDTVSGSATFEVVEQDNESPSYVLTLDGFQYSGAGSFAARNNLTRVEYHAAIVANADLKIVLNDENSIICEGDDDALCYVGICAYEDSLTISGFTNSSTNTSEPGNTLTINSIYDGTKAKEVIIENCSVNANSTGIESSGIGARSNVSINNAVIEVDAYFGGIAAPSVEISNSDVTATSTVAGIVNIYYLSDQAYTKIQNSNISVTGGVEGIYSDGNIVIDNESIVTAVGGVDGIYSWDSITINNGSVVTATGDDDEGICSYNGSVIIDGKSTVSATGGVEGIYSEDDIAIAGQSEVTAMGGVEGIYSDGDIAITGQSEVTADCGNNADPYYDNAAIASYYGNISIKDSTVKATTGTVADGCSAYGIVGIDVEQEQPCRLSEDEATESPAIYIENSTVVSTGATSAFNVAPTLAEDLGVYAGAVNPGTFVTSPSYEMYTTYKYVKIIPVIKYPVWVGDKQFTSVNSTIKGDDGNSETNDGTATYDPDTNTLTLNNFSYMGTGYQFVTNEYTSIYSEDDLVVKLIGNNTLESTETLIGNNTLESTETSSYAIYAYGNLTITDDSEDKTDGILIAKSISNDAIRICVDPINGEGTHNLNISNVTVKAITEAGNGIYSDDVIAIGNATVESITSDGFNKGIYGVDGITIKDSNVTAESGGGSAVMVYNGVVNISNSTVMAITTGSNGAFFKAPTLVGTYKVTAGTTESDAVVVTPIAETYTTNDYVKIEPIPAPTPSSKPSSKPKEESKKEEPTLVETAVAPTVTPAAEPEVQPAKKPVTTVVAKEPEVEVIGEVVVKDKEGLLGFGGMLEHTADQLTDILVSEAEKQLLEDGTDIYIYLENTEITDTVVEEEKELITAVVEELENAQIGAYIDINLYKQIGDKDAEKITNTDKPLTITLPIPQELINTDENVQRTYFMVRVHDGKAEIIDSIHDEPEQTLTFSTDRFSTYAIGYSDVVNEVVTEAEPAPVEQQEAFPWWIAVVGVVAATAIVGFGIYNKKKED